MEKEGEEEVGNETVKSFLIVKWLYLAHGTPSIKKP